MYDVENTFWMYKNKGGLVLPRQDVIFTFLLVHEIHAQKNYLP